MRIGRPRRAVVLAASLAALAGLGGTGIALSQGDEPPDPSYPVGTAPPALLGRLDAGEGGGLPQEIAAQLPSPFEVDPSGAVLARSHDGFDLYVTRSTEGPSEFCALVAGGETGLQAISCGPRVNIGTGLFVVTAVPQPGANQPGFSFGIAPDGYVSVRAGAQTRPITDNTFVLDRADVSQPLGAIEWTAASGAKVTADPEVLAGD